MDPEADCHTLETKAMSAEECKSHKDEIVAGIGRQEHFDDKYKVLWDGMKTLMTWNRMVIRIEATSDSGLGRATVCTRSAYIQNKMQKHGGTDAMKEGSQQKMFRSAAAVMGSLQTCVKKYNAELLQSYGPEEIGDCLCRLFEEIHCNRLMWQSQEASRKTLCHLRQHAALWPCGRHRKDRSQPAICCVISALRMPCKTSSKGILSPGWSTFVTGHVG